ncbi:MAG TPA: DsrE family protein [Saprospiraceae bacterium]|nr:DsrE family protein [Saprospiraceae bacterium]HNT19099.1 DsrE family protein [Saprospiraceae bacterium]
MKISCLKFMFCLLIFSARMNAQQTFQSMENNKHKIVIQFNEADSISQQRVTLQAAHIKDDLPGAEVEVVCLSGGIDLLITAYSKAKDAVAELTKKGVVFAACNHSMNSRMVTKTDLLKEAVVVPSAVIELALKQEQGWVYFKGGR